MYVAIKYQSAYFKYKARRKKLLYRLMLYNLVFILLDFDEYMAGC